MPRIHPIFGIIAVPVLACVVLLLLNSRESARATEALSNDMRMSKLTDDLNDQDPTVRHNAVEALATLGKPAVSPLITILESSDSDVKQNAAEQALGRIGEPSAEPLIGLLDASNSDVRQRAIQALGSIGSPATEPLVSAAMSSPGNFVNNRDRGIEKAFVVIGDPAVDRLINLLNLRDQEDGWHARWGAATALGEIKAARAIEPLRATAKSDKDLDVRRAAVQAIAAIEKAVPSSASTPGRTPSTAQSHLDRAKALWSSGESQKAIAECNAALRLDPDNEEAASLKEKYQKAVALLEGTSQ
jgi:hypothetical protein